MKNQISPYLMMHICQIVMLGIMWLLSPLSLWGQTSPERHTVLSDGHPVAVWSKREADPTHAVLLIHGRTWSARPDFDLQVPGEELSLMDALQDHGYAVYAIDLRGYGATSRDETQWLTPRRAAADVAAVLKWIAGRHITLGKPFVFGWSYGCLSAHLCLQNNPELASGVIFFGYPGMAGKPWPFEEEPDQPGYWQNTAAAAASDFIVPGAISQQAIETYVNRAIEADSIFVDWRSLDQWNDIDPSRLTTPMLLLEGQYDPYVDRYTSIDLFTRLGTANRQWTVIPDGDHAAFLEAPRSIFVRVLSDFIDRIGNEGIE